MSELRGVVVGHGRLAAALVDAVERISGITGALTAVSNTDCDRGSLEQAIDRLLRVARPDGRPASVDQFLGDLPGCGVEVLVLAIERAVAEGPALVFIDMPSGSCLFAAMRKFQNIEGIEVVTGVNLAMLLEFVFNRDGAADQVAVRVAEVGGRAIGVR